MIRHILISILKWQAVVVLKKYQPKIIVVTGSIGKTTTKDSIYGALSKNVYVRKSHKNFNNDIGVPLTILGLPSGWRNPWKWLLNVLQGFWMIIVRQPYPEWLVLEVGIRKPGDMDILKRWLRPDVVVVSAFGTMPSHVEFFEDKYGVWNEEASIIDALRPDGLLVLNHDDAEVMKLYHRHNRVMTFGTHPDATVSAHNYHIAYDEHHNPWGTVCEVTYTDTQGTASVRVPGVLGNNVIYAALAGLTVAHSIALPIDTTLAGLEQTEFPGGRMRVIPGVKNTTIIDDTYNSSPSALENAIDMVAHIRKHTQRRTIAVLGDMLDLGKHTEEEHRAMGSYVVDKVDIFIAVGIRAVTAAKQALESGMAPAHVMTFDDSREAGKFVERFIQSGDLILVKGSQGVRMERVVMEIMAHPELREKLLIRQEPEWIQKK